MSDSLIGKQLNNFRIERLLGRGGMAQVYYGMDVGLNRPVAIKVIDERWRQDEVFTARFITEAQTIAQWRHENIIQVYYAAHEDDLYYFVMEYIDGETLEERMKSHHEAGNRISYDSVIKIIRAVASGLDYAHSKGVIHRDIKPSNIMMDSNNRVVIMDFGLALDVDKGTIGESFGTPHYIAPEQARDASTVVAQSDQYALGVIAFEMLTGAVPFDNPSAMTVALMHMSEDPPQPSSLNPDLTRAVEYVLLKVLSKDPRDRFASCVAFVQELENALMGKPTLLDEIPTTKMQPVTSAKKPQSQKAGADQAPPAQPPATQPSGGNRMPVTIAIVAVIAFVVIGLLAVFGNNPAEEPTPTVVAEAVDEATDTAVPSTATDSPTNTPRVTETLLPGIVEATETDTVVPPSATDIPPTNVPPTATDIPPSATLVPPTNTRVPPTATFTITPIPVTSAPTLAYPQGSPVVLYYDNASFYVWNPNAEQIRTANFSFEALDADGNTLSQAFEGSRWTQFYTRIDGGGCVAIEITTRTAMNPPECQAENALVNTTQNSALVFWVARANLTQFRVLWQDEEVAICPVDVGICQFNIP